MITLATTSTQDGIGLVADDGDRQLHLVIPHQLVEKTETVKGLALHIINMLKPFTADELPLHKEIKGEDNANSTSRGPGDESASSERAATDN